MDLKNFDINESYLNKLRRGGITTAEELLVLPFSKLQKMFQNVKISEIQQLISYVSHKISPKSQTVYEMRIQNKRHHIKTNLNILDAALNGGFHCGNIIELVGPATVGKTQFCYHMAIIATMLNKYKGQEGRMVYIETEGKFSTERIVELISYYGIESEEKLEIVQKRVLESIVVCCPQTIDEMTKKMKELLKMKIDDIKIVIVDGMACLLRSEYDVNRLMKRQEILGQQGAILKKIAERFNVPVIVTNQVRASNFDVNGIPSNDVYPALGVRWAHYVNSRIILERLNQKTYLKIVKSPMCDNIKMEYKIKSNGIYIDEESVSSVDIKDLDIINATIRNS